MTLSEDQIALLTRQYDAHFLRWDGPAPQGAAPRPQGRHPPGPVPPAETSLGLRHMADPLARVLAGLYFVPPLFYALPARDADERDALNAAVVTITGLEPLLETGRVVRAVVTWSAGRWPKRVTGVRVSLPGGEAERRRLLGRFEPALRKMAAALAAPPYQHYAGRTPVGPPRR